MIIYILRSSITRLPTTDKQNNTREATVKETIKEEKGPTSNLDNESDKESSTDTSESGKGNFSSDTKTKPCLS